MDYSIHFPFLNINLFFFSQKNVGIHNPAFNLDYIYPYFLKEKNSLKMIFQMKAPLAWNICEFCLLASRNKSWIPFLFLVLAENFVARIWKMVGIYSKCVFILGLLVNWRFHGMGRTNQSSYKKVPFNPKCKDINFKYF